jgi:hypothetical protein
MYLRFLKYQLTVIVREAEKVWTDRLEEISFASAGNRTPFGCVRSRYRAIGLFIFANLFNILMFRIVFWDEIPDDGGSTQL